MTLGGGCSECCVRRKDQTHSRVARAISRRGTGARIATVGGSVTAGGGAEYFPYAWVNQLEFMRATTKSSNNSCAMIPSRWSAYEKRSVGSWCGASRGIFNLGEGGVSSSFTSLCLDSLVTQRCGFSPRVSKQTCGLDWTDRAKKQGAAADLKRRQIDWAAEDSRISSLTEEELGLDDISLIEFLVNDCALGHDQAAFERLIRHILQLPSKPAVVLLLLELRPGIDVETGLGMPVDAQCRAFREGEDDIESVKTRLEIPFDSNATEHREGPFDVAAAMLAVAHHLDLPVLDLRAAFFKQPRNESLDAALPLLLANAGGHRQSHPNNLGHSYIAYVIDEFLASCEGGTTTEKKDSHSQGLELLPPPLSYKEEEEESKGASCLYTSEVIAELDAKKKNNNNKKTVLEHVVPDASVLLGSTKLTYEGPWLFHDGLKDVTSYRVDRKYVAELQPKGALHIQLLDQKNMDSRPRQPRDPRHDVLQRDDPCHFLEKRSTASDDDLRDQPPSNEVGLLHALACYYYHKKRGRPRERPLLFTQPETRRDFPHQGHLHLHVDGEPRTTCQ